MQHDEKNESLQESLLSHGLQERSLPYRYIEYLQSLLKKEQEERASDSHAPFLSVILRTQGKRPKMLTEALQSLEKQTDQSFEILLILHNANSDGTRTVHEIVEGLDPDFRKKIEIQTLVGGTRTAPLNLGASLAKGHFFAMLDDDDLVYDNWVEVYHTAAQKHPCRVLRAYAHTQAWKATATADGTTLLSPVSDPQSSYCEPFDLVAHLKDNRTPISCVAIPTFCHRKLGILFDEALTTTEDWDYIMRCVLTVGVYDTECITFLYRQWESGETSRTLHEKEEWDANRRVILQKLNAIPILTTREALLQAESDSVTCAPSHRPVFSLTALCKRTVQLVAEWAKFCKHKRGYLRTLNASELFDADWYLKNNPDVQKAGTHPALHYLTHGWLEGRDPSPHFHTLRYLRRYPDVAKQGICPLVHYELYGKAEQREI